MTKTKTAYRIVCAKFGKDVEHRGHKHPSNSLAKVTQARIDADQHSEMVAAMIKAKSEQTRAGSYYLGEVPWRIQLREIGEWEDITQ